MASEEPNKLTITDNQTTKFQNNFLYKALILTLFLVLLPILPSQAPEFIGNNQSWELLHLLFVGIAISYGLFSRRNDEPEPEPDKENRKDSHDQSYVSRLLHVSSVFDDEPESPLAEERGDSSKVQTWSSQYHRKDHADSVVTVEKPLLLPVRSLKETSAVPAKTTMTATVKVKESDAGVVLPSPIPWRSRSGRFEVREEKQDTAKAESTSAYRSQAKISEDFLRKRKTNKSTPPPPPPPPPPPFLSAKNFPAEKSAKRFEFEKKMATDQSPGKNLGDSNKLLEEEEREDFFDKTFLESDMDETESENDENIAGRSSLQRDNNGKSGLKDEESGSVSSVNGDLGPDVDKKADEFIAKFREQIRLQRIESIKRSTAQMSKKLSR